MARKQPGQWPLKLICAALAACFAQGATALPSGSNVASGTATFAQNGSTLTVTNSNRAIINWGSFSIGSGETVVFNQATSSSVLNRVVGVTVDGRLVVAPSEILGVLQSPGKVFLINPAGTLIGAGAVIDVGGFVASSLTLSDADFLANRLNFTDVAGAGNIQNFGQITSTSGGSVYLIAPNVDNHGIIQAPNGEVILAAGRSVELLDSGTPGVKVVVNAGGQALNVGQLMAESGRVGMVGAVVKQQGTASTSNIVREGGRIFLKATQSAELAAGSLTRADGAQGGTIEVDGGGMTAVAGTVSATGSASGGGRIELLGDKVGVLDGALADASGASGGGTVLVGGDYQGKNSAVRNAQVSYLASGATLKADAVTSGSGGKVIVWADDTTRAYGRISARGGASSGDGGFVEVSGKRYLDFRGSADLRAPRGRAGTLLMDPNDVEIVSGSTLSNGSFTGNVFSAASAGSVAQIGWDTLTTQLGLGNVVVTTSGPGTYAGNITFLASPTGLAAGSAVITHSDSFGSWSTDYSPWAYASANALSFLAHNNINVNASFANAGTGKIQLVAGWDGASTSAPTVTAGTGNIDITAPFGSARVIANVGGSVDLSAGGTVRLKGSSGTGGSFSSAGIDLGGGGLTIKANNVELLAGADGGYGDTNSQAFIRSNGSQLIEIRNGGHLWLTGGGNAGEADYGNSAQLTAYGGGGQTINVSAGGSVEVKAGSGSGASTGGGGGCPTTGSNYCSNNFAEISTRGSGNQTIAFAGSGNLKVWGDLTGTANRGHNFAEIGVEGSGAQVISGNAAIEVKSAGVGGFFDGSKDFANEAGIFSEGTQSISGTTLTLDASGVSNGIGGAFLVAPQQTLNFTGNVALTGGSSNQASQYGMSAGAFIGHENGANVTLTTTAGNLAVNAGSGSGGRAGIGAASGSVTVQLQADSMNFNGTSAAAAGVGAFDGTSSATVTLTGTGTPGINLGSYSKFAAGSGSVAFVANNAGGASLSQAATSEIRAQTLSAVGNRSITLSGLNNNASYFSGSSSLASLTYNSNAPMVHVTSAQGATGVTLTTNSEITLAAAQANPRSIGLGSVSSSGGSVSVTAQNTILDDNGSGVANITTSGGNVTLTSSWGTPNAGELAISTDVDTAGTVTATVNGGPYGSVSIRDVGATAVNYAGINASAATAEGNVEYFRYGNLNIGGGTTLMLTPKTGFGTMVGASGDVLVSASLSMTGAKDMLVAGGNLTFAGGTLTMSGDGIIGAGGNLSLTGGNVSMQGADNTVFAGGLLNIGAGKTITAGMGTLGVVAGSINIAGTLSGFSDTFVYTPGTLAINGGSLLSTAGNLDFIAEGPMSVIGSVSAAQGIVGDALGGLTLGAAAGGSGSISANGGILDLVVGGTGIEMYNGSYLNSTDATQPNGGLISLFFPGLGAGGSLIDGVASFDGGYKVGGALTSLGQGLDVTYGILSNPVSDAIIAATTSASSSAGGTAQTDTSLALVTTTTTEGGAALTTTDTTQTIGGTTTTFGGETGTGTESTTSTTTGDGSSTTSTQSSQGTGSKQEDKNAKKKPAQCSA